MPTSSYTNLCGSCLFVISSIMFVISSVILQQCECYLFQHTILIGLKVCSIFAHLNNATNNLNNFDVHHACTQLHTWHKIDWKCIAGVFSSCTLSTALYFKECNYLSSVPSVVGYSKVAQSRLKISRVALLLAGSSTPSSLF